MKYLAKFVTKDIEESDTDRGLELTDELAEIVFGFDMEMPIDQLVHDFGYVTYNLRGGTCRWPVTCCVQRVHQQVGCRIWEAGVYLGELLAAMSSSGEFKGKTVLELGSGVGQTSVLLAACKQCPAKIILTDNPPDVLSNLERNIGISQDSYEAHRKLCTTSSHEDTDFSELEAVHLNWATATAIECRAFQADVVIAADCLYAEDLIPGFVSTLRHFVNDSSRDLPPYTLIACTMRNELTFKAFMREMDDDPYMSYEVVTPWAKAILVHPQFAASQANNIFMIKVFSTLGTKETRT